ncbi:MAG: ATP-dependent Clp protease proteolytic subunit [Eubacterium sp.]|nr:ATP-dependent Clp protease proteolytic subunit [Eubacterium sp.]
MKPVNILETTNSGKQIYSVDDYMFSNRELVLSDGVDSETMSEMIKRFMYLDRIDPGKEITLYITSPGGEVTSGLVFYDIIRMAKSPVKTVCIGIAASMGSIIFLAGDKRCMTKHSQIMIHDPSVTLGNTPSKALAVQDTLENLMKTREELARIIAERTGKPLRTVYSKTKGDSYFNAEEALEFGLATEIITEF